MKKNRFFQKTGLIAASSILMAFVQAQAADKAAAYGLLADIAVMATQAKANVAAAASSGDVAAITEASKRAVAIDAAMIEGQKAVSDFEAASDSVAEDEAFEAANNAWQKAFDALHGPVPEPTPLSKHEQWMEGQKNTGGGPRDAYDPPEVYGVPWHWSFGDDDDIGDDDATQT